MTIIRRAFSKISTPIIALSIILLFVIGFIGVLVLFNMLLIHSDVTGNLIYISPIFFLLGIYYKFRRSMLSETLWKVESRFIFIVGIFLSILITFNYWREVVTAPIIFFMCGIYGIAITYMVSQEGLESVKRNSSDLISRIGLLSSRVPQQVVSKLIILFLVSGYWFIQIQNNEQALKNDGINQALDLANFVVYLNPPLQAAVRVDSIKKIVFTKVSTTEQQGKIFQMCITFSLEESRNGLYFESLPMPEEICVNEDPWFAGWSENTMQDEVRNLVMKKLQ